ncbi:MAG TPA: hypothetical protein VG408_05840, partial [Actinomycetota bacterium]|nr:hypothetical protein [Actinomycetota bacterium]
VGQEFEVRLLAALLDAEDSTVLDTLSSLASRGLVEEVSALGTFRFGHVLIRETLYESQSPSRRRATHEAVARVLETIGGGHSGVIADHYFKAGGGADPGKADSLALEAADAAVTRGAWRDQERYLHRALALAELAGWTSEDLAELRARLERLREGPLDGPDTAQTKNAFVREGDYWTISFEGNYARFRASKGIAHLARLLGSPGVEIHSLELAGGSPASTSDLTFRDRGDSGPILDVEAKRAYRERIHDLREEIGEAERDGDVERAGRARTELEFLVEELSAAVGLGGRDRRVSSASERARVTVTRGIRSAIARISEELPALGEHLSATIRTGTFALYEPDPRAPAGWVILG